MLDRCRGGVATAASNVYETKAVGLARPVASPVGQALLAQRLTGDANPLFPFGWALWRMVGVQEQVPAIRASPSLPLQQLQAVPVHWRGCAPAAPVGPILGQGGVVRGRPTLNHPVSDDLRPGELDPVGAAGAVTEYPPVLPGLVEGTEVSVDDPGPRFLRVTELGPLIGEPPQVAIQHGECFAGHHCPVIGGPTPDDGVEPMQHRRRVRPSQGVHLGAEPFPDSSQGRFARFDQQLARLSADGAPEKVESVIEGDDARLVLVEGQTPGRQPSGEPCLDLFCLMPGVTQGDKIVGIPDQNRRVGCRYPGVYAGWAVPDPGGLFHPVQSNVQQQRTCYPALRSSLLGRGEPTVLDHTRLEPTGDESPGWERAEQAEQVLMINAVECR